MDGSGRDLDRNQGGRRGRQSRDPGQWSGHRARGGGANLRAVLHDEGQGGGDRSRAVHLRPHRREARGNRSASTAAPAAPVSRSACPSRARPPTSRGRSTGCRLTRARWPRRRRFREIPPRSAYSDDAAVDAAPRAHRLRRRRGGHPRGAAPAALRSLRGRMRHRRGQERARSAGPDRGSPAGRRAGRGGDRRSDHAGDEGRRASGGGSPAQPPDGEDPAHRAGRASTPSSTPSTGPGSISTSRSRGTSPTCG